MAAGTVTFQRRNENKNPLWPLSWRALYRRKSRFDIARLDQFDTKGFHFKDEIDRTRIRRLVILGHPQSPIYVDAIENLGVPDEIIILARCEISFETGYTGFKDRRSHVIFGYRYGFDEYLVEVYPDGSVFKVLREKTGQDIDGNAIIQETMRAKL